MLNKEKGKMKKKIEWFMARLFGEPFTTIDIDKKYNKSVVYVGHIYRGKHYIAGELWA